DLAAGPARGELDVQVAWGGGDARLGIADLAQAERRAAGAGVHALDARLQRDAILFAALQPDRAADGVAAARAVEGELRLRRDAARRGGAPRLGHADVEERGEIRDRRERLTEGEADVGQRIDVRRGDQHDDAVALRGGDRNLAAERRRADKPAGGDVEDLDRLIDRAAGANRRRRDLELGAVEGDVQPLAPVIGKGGGVEVD